MASQQDKLMQEQTGNKAGEKVTEDGETKESCAMSDRENEKDGRWERCQEIRILSRNTYFRLQGETQWCSGKEEGLQHMQKHPSVSIFMFDPVSSAYRSQWRVLHLPNGRTVFACPHPGACSGAHHLLPPTFLSNSMARHPGSCAWCPLSKSAYILRNEKITDLIYLLKASYHLHGEAVLRHLVSSLSDFVFFFFFYLLDDRLQALFHSAPKGTGNNPQYHFDLVCLLQIR